MNVIGIRINIENKEENTLETVVYRIKTDSLAFAEVSALTQFREEYPYTHGDVVTIDRKA